MVSSLRGTSHCAWHAFRNLQSYTHRSPTLMLAVLKLLWIETHQFIFVGFESKNPLFEDAVRSPIEWKWWPYYATHVLCMCVCNAWHIACHCHRTLKTVFQSLETLLMVNYCICRSTWVEHYHFLKVQILFLT